MALKKVVVTHWIHPEVTAFLEKFADEIVKPAESSAVYSRAEVLQHAATASALVTCMADAIDEDFLVKCPHLRIIAATLKGYDNYDAEACTRHGVWLTTVAESIIAPTAELALSLTLTLLRRVREGDELVRNGNFAGWRPQLYGGTLSGATAGLVGMGQLGTAVAEMLDGFHLGHTFYFDENRARSARLESLKHSWQRCDLAALMRQSNVIIICLPLTTETRHLIGAATLSLLNARNQCRLINVGRGSVVDEQAVLHALDQDLLAGYAADVFEFEDWSLAGRPDEVLPGLRRHPRALFTPHLGSAVDEVRREMSLEAASQVRQVLEQGLQPTGAVNLVKTAGRLE